MFRGLWRMLLGNSPGSLALLALPTFLAVLLDLALRGHTLLTFTSTFKTLYVFAFLMSAGFWVLPLLFTSRLFLVTGPKQKIARGALAAIFIVVVFPLITFSFGAQVLYFRVFHAYMGRKTIELGIALNGTVHDWFVALGTPFAIGGMLVSGALITFAIYACTRRAAPRLIGGLPILPIVGLLAALVSLWRDYLDTRLLQAAPPDICFLHGLMHEVRVVVTHQHGVHRGLSRRTPAPLPPLKSDKPHPPNVLLLLTESVRADALCSDPPPACHDRFFDDVVPDRISLGKLTSPMPSTFSACMALWTGLGPTADFRSAHSAPILWEIAHAVGYQTAYVTSQNPRYEDFGSYVQNAGIDHLVTAGDLGGIEQEQLGADDERATAAALDYLTKLPTTSPYFLVLHLSNTHSPYRIDPALEPFTPESSDPIGGIDAFHNHYRNSVAFQERTMAAFLKALSALPSWSSTVVVFLSDHGEQFREHGGLYHSHSLYDEELRVPGWLSAGPTALDPDMRAALTTYATDRTYLQDVFATLLDLFGVSAERDSLPFAKLASGRSLLRPNDGSDPAVLLATLSPVWPSDDPRVGAMRGDHVVMGAPPGPWTCFDTKADPAEKKPLPPSACGDLESVVQQQLGGAD